MNKINDGMAKMLKGGVIMLNKMIVLSAVLLSFSFARTSGNHKIVVAPDDSVVLKATCGLVSAKACIDDNQSIKWKRRHKRRKKTRRPQRGR